MTNNNAPVSKKAKLFQDMITRSGAGPQAPRTYGSTTNVKAEDRSSLEGAIRMRVNIAKLKSAPENMNFFHMQPEKVILDLSASLIKDGQLSPIIIRELPDEEGYQILAGHTRHQSAERAVGLGHTEWEELDAYCFPKGTCDDVRAMRIIIHSNLQGRGGRGLTPDEKFHCFVWEYLDELSNKENTKAAEITKQLMERYDVQKTQAYTYRSIAKNLSNEFLTAFREGRISIKEAECFASFDEETQKELFPHLETLKNISVPLRKLKNKSAKEILSMLEAPESESLLKPSIVNENDDEVTFHITVPRPAIPSFEKSIYNISKKYRASKF